MRIEKNASQLFCTGDIENINQAIDIYEKYGKKLLSTFYLLIKFFRQKIIPEEENITFDRKYKKRALRNFFLTLKNFPTKKNFQQKYFYLLKNYSCLEFCW